MTDHDRLAGQRVRFEGCEEQRGIGEVMHAPIEPGELVRVIGFSTFVKRYEQDLAPWLARFAAQIQLPQTWRHARLVGVRSLLADLDRELASD